MHVRTLSRCTLGPTFIWNDVIGIPNDLQCWDVLVARITGEDDLLILADYLMAWNEDWRLVGKTKMNCYPTTFIVACTHIGIGGLGFLGIYLNRRIRNC